MPLIREHNQNFPEWCELRSYQIDRFEPEQSATIDPAEVRTLLIVGAGSVSAGDRVLSQGEVLDLSTPGATEITPGPDGAIVIRMSGHWGDDIGGLGIFGVGEVEDPSDSGDPVAYPKRTTFDAHFHDCDEYWIVFEGRGVAVSEGIAYDVVPGDCVATGMGHHHDFPQAEDPVRAVFFETTMQGEKRRGHLWEHTHGPAQPRPERT